MGKCAMRGGTRRVRKAYLGDTPHTQNAIYYSSRQMLTSTRQLTAGRKPFLTVLLLKPKAAPFNFQLLRRRPPPRAERPAVRCRPPQQRSSVHTERCHQHALICWWLWPFLVPQGIDQSFLRMSKAAIQRKEPKPLSEQATSAPPAESLLSTHLAAPSLSLLTCFL